jgi:hypothetical protein
MYCTRMGAFEVSQVSNHDIDAIFRGPVTLADGPAGGDPVAGEARVVRLVE